MKIERLAVDEDDYDRFHPAIPLLSASNPALGIPWYYAVIANEIENRNWKWKRNETINYQREHQIAVQ